MNDNPIIINSPNTSYFLTPHPPVTNKSPNKVINYSDFLCIISNYHYSILYLAI